MDETLTTNTVEPTVVEAANTSDVNTAGYNQVIDTQTTEGSQVIESSTPMDNNVTYNNIPNTQPSFDPNKDFTQNIVQNAVDVEYNNNLNNNAGTAMDQFLNQDYDYDHNEAGTYWVAGAINDVNTQMSFLNTLIREDMYDELDLQKYYYDSTMATARAYAAQKKKEVAYGYYRAAQEKAIAEAQLTGWYMPAEGNYMLGQYTVAQNKLEDSDTTDEEKAKARRVSNTVEKWFNANQIGTRGIKCLNMMNYEENVRHNTIMGELQKQANQIAASQAGASAASVDLKLREFIFSLEEYELQSGHNITKELGFDNKDFLGHDTEEDKYRKYQALQGFSGKTSIDPDSVIKLSLDPNNTAINIVGKDQTQTPYDEDRLLNSEEQTKVNKEGYLKFNEERLKERGYTLYQDKDGNWYAGKEKHTTALANLLHDAPDYYAAILGSANQEWVNNVLKENGMDANESHRYYVGNTSYTNFKAEIDKDGNITAKNAAFTSTNKKTSDGNDIVTTVVNDEVVAGYFKDGVWNPITDSDYVTSDGTRLNDLIEKKYGTQFNTEGVNAVEIDGQTYGFGRQPSTNATTNYKMLTDDLGYKKVTVNNWRYYDEEKVKSKVNASQTPEGTLDKDGNTVKNLRLEPNYYDDNAVNEFMIMSGEDNEGNKKYYSVETDGELKPITGVKKAPESLKQGFADKKEFEQGVDLNADNPHEIVSKLSYVVTYNKKENCTVMAYPHADGSVEYYTVEGNIKANDLSSGKVLSLNISDEEVERLGGKTVSSLNKTAVTKTSSLTTATKKEAGLDLNSLEPVSSSVSSSSPIKSGYEVQDTVEKRKALYNKYQLSDKEREDFDSIRDITELEKKLKNRYDSILGQGGNDNGR